MLFIESTLTSVEAGDRGLQRGELSLGLSGPSQRVLPRLVQPTELGIGTLSSALERVDLTGQPRQPLPAICGRSQQPGHLVVFFSVRRLGSLAVSHG